MNATTPEIVAALGIAREIALASRSEGATRAEVCRLVCRTTDEKAAEALGLGNPLDLVEIMAGKSTSDFLNSFPIGDSKTDRSTRGRIRLRMAYAQGKMLNHGSWQFTKNRTFSDIDAVLDNDGKVLFVELERRAYPINWPAIGTGQAWLYESVCQASNYFACALARHNVEGDDVEIDSRNDILDAVVCYRRGADCVRLTGDEYRKFVELWDASYLSAVNFLDTIAASQREATA